MSAEILDNTGGIVTVRLNGKLTDTELVAAQKAVADIIRQQGKVRVLVRAEAFEGWARGGQWDNFEHQAKNDPFVQKMAIIGDKKWEELAYLFAAKDLRPFPIEYFAPRDLEKARAWLKQDA